jgi:hypothetical protein
VKRSSIRAAVDQQLRKDLQDLQMTTRKVKEHEQKYGVDSFSKAHSKLMKRWNEHQKSYDAWWPRTEARLKEDFRRRLMAAESPEQVDEAGGEYMRRMRNFFDLRHRWVEEGEGHLNALDAPAIDIFEYSKVMRNWMKSWESLWALPPEGVWFQMSSV